MKLKRSSRKVLPCAALIALLVYLTLKWVLVPYRVRGGSMEPTLLGGPRGCNGSLDGDIVLVSRLAYLFGSPGRWEIIVRKWEGEGERSSVKRVVGLPGETIEVRSGQLIVNGTPLVDLPDPLRKDPPVSKGLHGHGPVSLGPNEFFVLGDSSYLSQDSRAWGPIQRESIVGKALFIISPMDRVGWLR